MSNKKATGGGLGETVRTVIYAVLIAIGLRTFAFEPFSIPSGSMLPTLLVGDYLFVSKFSYGYSRFSLPWGLRLFDGRVLEKPVERGEVVVFRLPADDKIDYIKRIIGLPGDQIQVKAGILHINGEPVQREKVASGPVRNRNGVVRQVTEYVETLPNGVRHRIWERSDSFAGAVDTRVFQVPAGHYFAMGDNRDESRDSRFAQVGPIPSENLIGRAEVIFFSHDGSARWWQVWRWPGTIRFDRLFDAID